MFGVDGMTARAGKYSIEQGIIPCHKAINIALVTT
jgi:hypothetical protein